MPEHGRLRSTRPSARVRRCPVPGCLVCAAGAERQLVTVAEWVAEHVLSALCPAPQRPASTTRGWPYSSWWEECGG